ncbi:MAG: DedA family protein [Thermoanaerobaculia bacterium]
MEEFVEAIVQAVLGLRGATAYALVAFFAFAEAAAFLGLFTPGDVVMILGGVLASQGRVDLGVLVLVAAGAAALGDSTSYWLGRRFGRRLLSSTPVQRRFSTPIDRATRYFQRRGGQAVFFGRFATVVRTFIPFVAGSTRMSYPRFLLFSVPAVALWVAAVVFAGFIAGQSWEVVSRFTGPAGVLILLLLFFALLLRRVARKAIANQQLVRERWERFMDMAPIAWLRGKFGAQLRWLGRRFDPRLARGLSLTLGFVILAASAVAVGLVLSDVRSFEGLALLDLPVRAAFRRLRTDAAVAVAEVVVATFTLPWMLLPTAAIAGWIGWRNSPRVGARAVVGAIGAVGISLLVQQVVVERIGGTEFPPTSVIVVAALGVQGAAAAAARVAWAQAVTIFAIGAFGVALVGVAVLVLLTGTFSGVLLGAVLGVSWASAVELQGRLPFRLSPESPGRPIDRSVDLPPL